MVAVLAIGMVSMFAAAPVAAHQQQPDCNAASTSGDATATSNVGVGGVAGVQDTDAVTSASSIIDNAATIGQSNVVSISESGGGAQTATVMSSNSLNVDQC